MIQDIPFRDLPRQSALFLSYLDLAPAALRYYPQAPTLANLETFAAGGLAGLSFPRKAVASILRRQNAQYGHDLSVLQQIDNLEKPDSVAIVTGQQVGLFTGPIYTIYKALTAVAIAAKLRSRGLNAIPIFWMETGDHDFSEATRRTVLNSETSAQTVDYGKWLFAESGISQRPVGSVQFPENIRAVTQDYVRHLPESPWKASVRELLESAYVPGTTFALAFARLMRQCLQGYGLILFDPGDVEAKQLMAPVYLQALRDAPLIHALLLQRSQEMQAAGFHAQAQVLEHSTVLFLTLEGERRALEWHASKFRIKHSELQFTADELEQQARQTPEIFSPSVLLRPIVQDHLFPTAAYVGGAAEIAYFAQIECLYSLYHRPMPVIWPRNGFTLIASPAAAAMHSLGIGLRDCLAGKQTLAEKMRQSPHVMRRPEFSEATGSLEQLEALLRQNLAQIRPRMGAIDRQLECRLDSARRKILHTLQHLRARTLRLEALQPASCTQTLDALMNQCLPGGDLQERALTFPYFLARFGPSLLETLQTATQFDNFSHRVLQLDAPPQL